MFVGGSEKWSTKWRLVIYFTQDATVGLHWNKMVALATWGLYSLHTCMLLLIPCIMTGFLHLLHTGVGSTPLLLVLQSS